MQDGSVPGSEVLSPAVVRIRNTAGAVVGAGLLVSAEHVCTCAHVVASALGGSDDTAEPPEGLMSLDFPMLGSQARQAEVVDWEPFQGDETGDLALLRLTSPAPTDANPAGMVVAGMPGGIGSAWSAFPAAATTGCGTRNCAGWSA
ncbi:trypsin-like peptidase domain-containing protein [Saccharothrix sp. AJ9571]|nr:trypsin-like peptidase domain-containing protein [Saccharothrix sp. AJ9571]